MIDLARAFYEADPARTPTDTVVPISLVEEIIAVPRDATHVRSSARQGVRPWALVASVGVLVILVVAVLMRPGGGGDVEPPMGDYPWYETESALIAASDGVARGRVVSVRELHIEDTPYTSLLIDVDDAAKGPLTGGDRVEVLHASSDPSPLSENFVVGDEAIIFLALGSEGEGYLVNPVQGIYLVAENGDVQAIPGNPVKLSQELLVELGF